MSQCNKNCKLSDKNPKKANTDDSFDKEDVAEWLEELVKNYWAVKQKRETSKSLSVTPAEVTKFPIKLKKAIFHSGTKETECVHPEMAPTENVNVQLTYSLGQEKSDRTQNLVSKIFTIPIVLPDGQIDNRAAVRKREVEFHTQVIPDLEAWTLSRGAHINFGIPACFHGNFEYVRNGMTCTEKELITKLQNLESPPPEANGIEIYTMLLLEDLDRHGYTRSSGTFTVNQVKDALKQVAVVHAVSWAWQTTTKTAIKKKWPIFLNTKQSAKLYGDLIKRGLPLMQNALVRCLENMNNTKDLYLVDRLKIIEPKIYTYLHTNLIPCSFPAPNCIIHLDLQFRNIFFKEKQKKPDEVGEISNESQNAEAIASVNINKESDDSLASGNAVNDTTPRSDCKIENWGISHIGPPMHDVAFLIFTSLPPDVRRQHTNSIIKSYYKAFKETCEKLNVELTFSLSHLLSQYPKSLLLSVLFVIGNLRHFSSDSTVEHDSMIMFIEALKDLVTMRLI